MKHFLILLLIFPTLAFARDFFSLSEEELDPEAEEVLIKKPEKYLRNESMIYDFDTDLGIKDQRRYTGNDGNRLSLAGHVSADYEHVNSNMGVDVTYMHRTKRYNQIWWGFQLFQNRAYFDAITQNPKVKTGDSANADSMTPRPNDAKQSILAGGLGVGYRFKLLLDFFSTEDMFESIDVFANYVTLDETYAKQKYKGYGLTTNYGIHKRTSTSFFYGGKLSYNVASVTRGAIDGEKKSERSLALGWLSAAFELGFFF